MGIGYDRSPQAGRSHERRVTWRAGDRREGCLPLVRKIQALVRKIQAKENAGSTVAALVPQTEAGLQIVRDMREEGTERPLVEAVQIHFVVGVRRFELRASWSQTKRSDLTELHPGVAFLV